MRNPAQPLPEPGTAYTNAAYYAYQRSTSVSPRPPSRAKSVRSVATSRRSRRTGDGDDQDTDGVPLFKKQFQEFHAENGVRTVFGQIGPVRNGALCAHRRCALTADPGACCSPHAPQNRLPACVHVTDVRDVEPFWRVLLAASAVAGHANLAISLAFVQFPPKRRLGTTDTAVRGPPIQCAARAGRLTVFVRPSTGLVKWVVLVLHSVPVASDNKYQHRPVANYRRPEDDNLAGLPERRDALRRRPRPFLHGTPRRQD